MSREDTALHVRNESQPDRVHLRNLTLDELQGFLRSYDLPDYRYRQIASWLYDKLASDFADMTDLPLALRDRLGRDASVGSLRTRTMQISALDGTKKFLFELSDGNLVESVLMQYDRRITFCVSSQVGCPLDCVFCQTGKGVFGRNLTAGEIIDQISALKRTCADDVDKVNVVFMGMGEPMLNLPQVARAIQIMNDPAGFDMGSRRITVSTVGHPRRMRQLADMSLRCSMALSLNATTDEQRGRLMPAVSSYTVTELIDAARYFAQKSGRRVTLEYVLLKGLNTSIADAKRLGKLARRGPFKINLIPYNAGRDTAYETLSEDEIQVFIRDILPYAPTVTVRRSKGPDIDAACGQLWTKSLLSRKKPARVVSPPGDSTL